MNNIKTVSTIEHYKLFIFFLCLIFASSLFFQGYPNILSIDLMQNFNFSVIEFSYLTSFAMIGSASSIIFIGIITDKYGPHKTLTCLLLISGLATIVFVLGNNANLAIFSRLFTGIGLTLTLPILTLIAKYFNPNFFGRITSIVMASGNLGFVLANMPLVIASQYFGWKLCLIFMSVNIVILAAIFYNTVPKDQKNTIEKNDSSVFMNLKTILKNKQFLLICFWNLCFPGLIMSYLTLWSGSYLMQACSLSQAQVGSIISIIMFTAIPIMPIVSWLSESVLYSRKKILVVSSLLTFVFMACLAFISGSNNYILHLIIGALFFYSGSSSSALAISVVKELFPANILGTALGLYNVVNPLSVASLQFIFAMLIQNRMLASPDNIPLAYEQTLYFFIFLTFLGLIASFFLKETFKKT